MALRNGLLVHGPTHWAAAVRTRDGEIKAASGRKPRVDGASTTSPACGASSALGEAMAVIPLVKRALPEAQLPFQDAGSSARWPRRPLGDDCCARVRGAGAEAASAAISLLPEPRRAARAASWPPTTASSTRRSRPTRTTTPTPRTPPRSTTAAARTSWRRCCSPTSRARRCCAARSSDRAPPLRRRSRVASLGAGRRGLCVERTPFRQPDGAALRRPGHELQRVLGTREPTEEQLEVGRAALAEILRVERAPQAALEPSTVCRRNRYPAPDAD